MPQTKLWSAPDAKEYCWSFHSGFDNDIYDLPSQRGIKLSLPSDQSFAFYHGLAFGENKTRYEMIALPDYCFANFLLPFLQEHTPRLARRDLERDATPITEHPAFPLLNPDTQWALLDFFRTDPLPITNLFLADNSCVAVAKIVVDGLAFLKTFQEDHQNNSARAVLENAYDIEVINMAERDPSGAQNLAICFRGALHRLHREMSSLDRR